MFRWHTCQYDKTIRVYPALYGKLQVRMESNTQQFMSVGEKGLNDIIPRSKMWSVHSSNDLYWDKLKPNPVEKMTSVSASTAHLPCRPADVLRLAHSVISGHPLRCCALGRQTLENLTSSHHWLPACLWMTVESRDPARMTVRSHHCHSVRRDIGPRLEENWKIWVDAKITQHQFNTVKLR